MSEIDYDALWHATVSAADRRSLAKRLSALPQLSTLSSLTSLKISPLRIKSMPGAQLIVGGFGDVEQAELRTSLFFGVNTVVALKKLRPTGHREQRMRVIAVSRNSLVARTSDT